ncbi:MAG: M6 family metalloprotease domain-containing protein [Bacteroidales bacterium]|nr:M6 family metalloprotease domain-containing protein [Bacteroidales bacterium]
MIDGNLMTPEKDIPPRTLYNRLVLIILTLLVAVRITAAPLWFEPYKATLPDGKTLNLFMSGDEFFNWLHDTLGYPVKQAGDGWFYYMQQNDSIFTFTGYRADVFDPLSIPGIKPVSIPSNTKRIREEFYRNLDRENEKTGLRGDTKFSGVFNNLVIYIKFSDQSDFTTSRSTYDTRLNSLTTASVRHYYKEVSYDKVDMISYHAPGAPTENICYTDIYPRDYYRPSSASNPDGYTTSAEKTSREHNLLARTVKYIDDNFQKPSGVNFDSDGDGRFDNVAFIIRGTSDAWNDLLWPHRWSLYTLTANLWGKRVYGYTLQLEAVSVKTFTHEMFHALGAPDLYHYESDGISPAGNWDLMNSGGGHMLSWMKAKYGGWISSIPEITQSGTYTLLPLTSPIRNSFRIKSPYSSDQYVVLEYRYRTGLYESTLPSSGIIISRIDTRYRGNAQGPPDEVYVFRPGGTPTANGTVNSATFSDLLGRTSFNETTNPYPFLQDGSKAGIFIRDIKYYTDSMTFTVDMDMPTNLEIVPMQDSELRLNWSGPDGKPFLVAVSSTNEDLTPGSAPAYSPGDPIGSNGTILYKGTSSIISHTSLGSDELYYYSIWTILDEANGVYSIPLKGQQRTGIYTINALPHREEFSAVAAGTLPRGWKTQGGDSQWDPVTSSTGDEAVVFRNMGSESQWFYTPGFYLTSQKTYMITFRYRNHVEGNRERLTLYAGTDRHNNGLINTTLYYDSKVEYSDYVIARAIFKPQIDAVHYFGMISTLTAGGIEFDDFKIERVPATTRKLSKPVQFYPNPTTGKIIVPAEELTTVSVHTTGGTLLFTKIIEGTSEIDLSHLNSGIYVIKFSGKSETSSSRLVITYQLP